MTVVLEWVDGFKWYDFYRGISSTSYTLLGHGRHRCQTIIKCTTYDSFSGLIIFLLKNDIGFDEKNRPKTTYFDASYCKKRRSWSDKGRRR